MSNEQGIEKVNKAGNPFLDECVCASQSDNRNGKKDDWWLYFNTAGGAGRGSLSVSEEDHWD